MKIKIFTLLPLFLILLSATPTIESIGLSHVKSISNKKVEQARIGMNLLTLDFLFCLPPQCTVRRNCSDGGFVECKSNVGRCERTKVGVKCENTTYNC